MKLAILWKIFTKSFAVLKNSSIFAVPNERETIIGVWRSWLAHLVWDQRVLCSSHSTPTRTQSNYLKFKWLLFLLVMMPFLVGITIHTCVIFFEGDNTNLSARILFVDASLSIFMGTKGLSNAP